MCATVMNPINAHLTRYNLVQVSESLLHLQGFFDRDALCSSGRLQPVVVLSPCLFTSLQLFVKTNQDLSESEVQNDANNEAGQDDSVADAVRLAEFLVPNVTTM